MTDKVTIIGAIASRESVVLYMQDGSSRALPADAWKTRKLVDVITPSIARHEPVTVDLDAYSAKKVVEAHSKGRLRFFVRKVKEFFGVEDGQDEASLPGRFDGEETIIGSIDGKEIPGLEKIIPQIEHAASSQENSTGFITFMQRISYVINKRSHEIQDLLEFMRKGDLPIADDGSIVAYKRLFSRPDNWFVDPHTQKVHQRPGSYVSMNPDMVDSSRRTECSTGLHIGRRDYMKGFRGDVIMLVKIAPENVIAVPQGEASKIRAAGYHIIAKVPDAGFALLNQDRPMTRDNACAELLDDVLRGRHGPIRETVLINGALGTNVTITPVRPPRLDDKRPEEPFSGQGKTKARTSKAKPRVKAQALEPTSNRKIDVKSVNEKAVEARSGAKPQDDLTNTQREALKLAAQGVSKREIERRLPISARSIKRLQDRGY